jgi:hypothetical protein
MAFPTSWSKKCKLTIDHTKVTGDLANFPVLLTVANLPSAMFDADGPYPAINGGGDIRFSSDIAGVTQLPCEVCQFVTDNTPANGLAEIWVKLTSVSSSVDSAFYIWWRSPGQTQPARNNAYGLENVWDSSFRGVWHLSEAWIADADNFKDSTANVKHGTRLKAYGTTTVSTAGKWGGKCINFQGSELFSSNGNTIEVNGSGTLNFSSTLTVEYWQQWNGYSGVPDADIWAVGKADGSGQDWQLRGLGMREGTGSTTNPGKIWWNTTAGDESNQSTSTYARDTWMHVAVAVTNSSTMAMTFYGNGAADGSTTPGGTVAAGTRHFTMGEGVDNEYHRGHLDEVRISSTNRSSQWINATYNTTNAPNTFLTAGPILSSATRSNIIWM